MDQQPDIDKPEHTRRWRAQAITTLAAWLIAFPVAVAVSAVFDNKFASLPRPLRALVLSGILVALMVNLVMPAISAVRTRRLSSSPDRNHRRGALESKRR